MRLTPRWLPSQLDTSPPSLGNQIIFFNCLDLHHRSPHSASASTKSKNRIRRFDARYLALAAEPARHIPAPERLYAVHLLKGLEFGVWGLGFRVWGLGFGNEV
jgi:hypothetical protein